MSPSRRLASLAVFAVAIGGAVIAACSSGGPTPSPFADAAPPPPPARGPAAAAVTAPSASAPLPKVEFHEDDFAETDRSRDPFRSYAKLFSEQGKTRVKSQRQVLLDHYAIDDLKLVGLVTRTDTPRAMLVDPSGRGWVVTKGQFIGRAEVVHAGGPGGVDYELNWRVDRIRDTDLVLVREDPAHSDIPPATRVIALRTENPNEQPQ
jgi:type IV pilus assembly protein PilP